MILISIPGKTSSASLAGCATIAAILLSLAFVAARAQVITVDTKTGTLTSGNETVSTVDRRYRQVEPTRVPLTKSVLDAKTRLELIRTLQAEQGFAMRPFPTGHKGLTLVANGMLEPHGEAYLAMVTKEGLSASSGDRLVITDVKIERSRMIFDLNGGPDQKHRFLRHVQIGVGPDVTTPVVQDEQKQQVGARLTLTFEDHIPELTAAEVKALLAPLISFDVKSPIQAFTDTLPPKLKDAILGHQVLVGMTTDMVIYAKGQPQKKTREMDGQMPFEEWIYGTPPKDVEFVRINGNRVIRLEIAKIGETPVVYTKDEVEGLMRTDGTSVLTATDSGVRTSEMGDVERNPDTQSPSAPPSLRNAGEKLPGDKQTGVMKPVQFPKQKTDTQTANQPGANPDEEPSVAPTSATPDATQSSPPSPQTPVPQQPK
jgi:hypothetical protein